MNTSELILNLTSYNAVSGYENSFTGQLCDILKRYTEDVTVDRFNNVIAAVKSEKANAPKVMLEAHIDQIGLMVSEIKDNGTVGFVSVGGIDPRILPASDCVILGRERVCGVIEEKSHDKEKLPKIEDMSVFTGFGSEHLKSIISVGDPVVFDVKPASLCNDQLAGAALDDRAGIASLIMVMDKIKNANLNFDLYFMFSSQEELGMHGAYSGADEIQPDLAIAVDVTHGLTPSVKKEDGAFETGGGAIICRGPSLDYDLTNKLIDIAEKKSIKYDIEVAAGNSGTDAWAIQTAGSGVRTMLVSIPLKYMHTTVETIDVLDVEAVADLICEFLLGGDFNA